MKPTPPEQRIVGYVSTYPGGRITCLGCSLQFLIMLAYNLQPFQIQGGPSWLGSERFDVDARSPAASQADAEATGPKKGPNPQQSLMLQGLLADRFHLAVKHEAVEGKIYRLTASNPKLTPAADPHAFPWAGSVAGGAPGGDGLKGTNITMDQLAVRMSDWLHRSVVNETGLKGSYDFLTRVGDLNEEAPSSQDVESAMLSSLHALGLNLTSGRGLVDGVLIQHAEQPTPN